MLICETCLDRLAYLALNENITTRPLFCPADISNVGMVVKGSNTITRSSAILMDALVNHITSSFMQCPPLTDLSHMNVIGLHRKMLLNSAQAPYATTTASKL